MPIPVSRSARHQKTHLDALPPELILQILHQLSGCRYFTKQDILGFHTAWPGSRYALLGEPLLHFRVKFDGSASRLARILAKLAARPETRFWARVLSFPEDSWGDNDEPDAGGEAGEEENVDEEEQEEAELLSLQQALNRILPAAEAERITASSFLTPVPPSAAAQVVCLQPADRVRVLACLLPNVTRLGMALRLPGWVTGTTASLAYHTPAPGSPALVPVLGNVENVLYFRKTGIVDYAVQPRELLWALLLPKVRMVVAEWVQSRWSGTSEPGWGMSRASGVQVLHLDCSALGAAELEALLRLPSALREFAYNFHFAWDQGEIDYSFSPRALARGLSAQMGSLEVLSLIGAGSLEEENGGVRGDERLGSLRGFTKLRELEVRYWMLAGPVCSCIEGGGGQRVEDARVGLSGLPPGLVRLRLELRGCQRCEGGWCEFVKRHLERFFECKGEWVPRLEKLELVMDYQYPDLDRERDLERMQRVFREMAESRRAKVEVYLFDFFTAPALI